MATTTTRLLTVLTLCAALCACAAGFKTTVDHDKDHDFTVYKTYAWISDNPMIVGPTTNVPSPLLEGQIMKVIETSMNTRGYRKVDEPESADFAVSFTVGSREEIRIDSYPATYSAYGYPRGRWGGMYYGMGTETTVRQYDKGMLAIDVFDVAEHRPVWHGVATKNITSSDRKNRDETIQAAVDSILISFPPL
ncbi:MAG: DUF4136 domain-containing protein [Pseudomonadota bacterium]